MNDDIHNPSYLASLFEAKGRAHISSLRGLRVTLRSHNNKPFLESIQATYGGYMGVRRNRCRLELNARQAISFLRLILPHLSQEWHTKALALLDAQYDFPANWSKAYWHDNPRPY